VLAPCALRADSLSLSNVCVGQELHPSSPVALPISLAMLQNDICTVWRLPDGVIGIFHWHDPSGRTMTLGSTRPLTEMSTRDISWGVKAAGA